MALVKKVKNTIINILVKRKYNLVLAEGASTDLKTFYEGHNLVNKNAGIYLSHVGLGTYVAGYTSLSRAKIGRYCSIGQHVKNSFGIHPANDYVSTHPAFFSTKRQAGFSFVEKNMFEEHKFIDSEKKYLIEIGNDVWIGNNVMIFDGIRIGDGAIVGAGSVVTKDIEPYSIVGGIPAKLIRKRFTSEQIDFLLKYKWWEKDFNWISQQHQYFSSIEMFINRFNREL